MFICQDYNTTDNNIFAPEKVTINITNCTYNGQRIEFDDPADVCATGDANQLIYVYSQGNGGIVSYDATKYPAISAN